MTTWLHYWWLSVTLFSVMYRSPSSSVYQFTIVSRLLDFQLFNYTITPLHKFPRQRTTQNRKHLLSSRGERCDELARPTKAGDFSFIDNLKILHSVALRSEWQRTTLDSLTQNYSTTLPYEYTKKPSTENRHQTTKNWEHIKTRIAINIYL